MAARQKNDSESLDRYEKLLQDWKPGPPQPRAQASAPSPQVRPQLRPQAQPARPAGGQEPSAVSAPVPGTILLISGSSLAVYLKYMPEKEYHLALMLAPNGSVKAQGVALEGHQVDELGSLPARFVDELKQNHAWSRDLIVFHCYSYDDVRRLPGGGGAVGSQTPGSQASAGDEPAVSPAAPGAAEPATPGKLVRGQRLTIRFGANAWEAVYWGRDDQSTVIAHKTNNEWALMHLDLERFQNDMDVSPESDPALLQEIEADLLNK